MQKHLIMSTLNDRRIAEYQTYISKFINDIQGVDPTGIPEPHIPVFGETYEKCKYKMVFCGMETYGWGELKNFIQNNPDELVTASDYTINELEYLKWRKNDHATFWGFILKFLSAFYKVDFQDIVNPQKYPDLLKSFIWANANSIERYEVTACKEGADQSSWLKVKEASKNLDNLNHIINVAKPHVVFILYKDADENFFLKEGICTKAYGVNTDDRKNYLRIDDKELGYSYYYRRDSDTHIFHMPHPRYFGVKYGFEKYISSILEKIQLYNIWPELPSSDNNEWFIDNEPSNDKSSIEYKRIFIADLAKVLVEHKMIMSGNELRELFNQNKINTSYGTPYSNTPSGNRGIHKVISSTWKYYESIGDHQTAYNIARAFVNQYNAYAYE